MSRGDKIGVIVFAMIPGLVMLLCLDWLYNVWDWESMTLKTPAPLVGAIASAIMMLWILSFYPGAGKVVDKVMRKIPLGPPRGPPDGIWISVLYHDPEYLAKRFYGMEERFDEASFDELVTEAEYIKEESMGYYAWKETLESVAESCPKCTKHVNITNPSKQNWVYTLCREHAVSIIFSEWD